MAMLSKVKFTETLRNDGENEVHWRAPSPHTPPFLLLLCVHLLIVSSQPVLFRYFLVPSNPTQLNQTITASLAVTATTYWSVPL